VFKFDNKESEESEDNRDIRAQDDGKIRAPDVSFTSKETYRNLNEQQLQTFKGEAFTPVSVIEVGNIGNDTSNEAFVKADNRFKDEFFADGTSVG
jgi:hypothetical protein